MKLKSTPLLLLSVVFILLVACGGGSQVVAPTPEAEVVSNAMVEATAQAIYARPSCARRQEPIEIRYLINPVTLGHISE